MIQHNGFYSCTYCICPGEKFVTKNGGNAVAFPPSEDTVFQSRSERSYQWALKQLIKECNYKKINLNYESFSLSKHTYIFLFL